MFPARYFPSQHFADPYWPKHGPPPHFPAAVIVERLGLMCSIELVELACLVERVGMSCGIERLAFSIIATRVDVGAVVVERKSS